MMRTECETKNYINTVDVIKCFFDSKGHFRSQSEILMDVLKLPSVILQESTVIDEIPKDYEYDTETKDFLVYRHKYTGDEIHIEKPIPLNRIKQGP